MRPRFSSVNPLLRTTTSSRKSGLSSLSPLTSPDYQLKFGLEECRRLLETCVLDRNLVLGSQLHTRILTCGLQSDSFLSTKLVTLYSLCGNLPTAEAIFDRFVICNVFLLNAMIRGCTCSGLYRRAVDIFGQKRKGGLEPDSYTFSCVLKACALSSDLRRGKEVHSLVVGSGLEPDLFVSNSLICMYAKCGCLEDGVRVFDRMPQRDIVSWNSVISAYAQNAFDLEGLVKVRELVGRELRTLDQVTVVSTLALCSFAETVREIHGYTIRNGFESTSRVRNALISAYGKCGRVREACRVFDSSFSPDKVSWNALISCYAQNGFFEDSVRLLCEMRLSGFDVDVVTYSGIISSFSQNNLPNEAMETFEELLGTGLKLDVITVASILPAIADLQLLEYCKEMHAYSYRHRLEPDRRIRNALVSVYGKCGLIHNACRVFEEIEDRDLISWSSMVVGYAQNGNYNESLDVFRRMTRAEIEPNPISITSVLSACSGVSGLRQGKEVHLWAVKNSLEGQTFVGSALIDMYAKCGKIKDSRRVFDLMKEKNSVTWNSMIAGYAVHGLGEEALKIFRSLEEPDEVSFIAALSACSHGGLVEEGIEIFNSMEDLKVSPQEGHYACMVDILGRSGRLDRAFDLVRTMPMEANAEIWGSLLGACKIHCNLEIGIYSGAQIIETGCGNSGYYVLLSNILADSGRWSDVEVMRKLMKEKGVKKGVGCSWIEVKNEVHSFVARERAQHPEWESLFRVLRFLSEQMKGMCF